MIVKTARLTTKGQLTVPAEVLRSLRAKPGTEFLIIQQGEKLVLMKAQPVAKKIVDDFEGWESLGADVFNKLWDNEADEVWNDA